MHPRGGQAILALSEGLRDIHPSWWGGETVKLNLLACFMLDFVLFVVSCLCVCMHGVPTGGVVCAPGRAESVLFQSHPTHVLSVGPLRCCGPRGGVGSGTHSVDTFT